MHITTVFRISIMKIHDISSATYQYRNGNVEEEVYFNSKWIIQDLPTLVVKQLKFGVLDWSSWQVVLSSKTAQDQEHPSVKKLRFAVLDKSHLGK